MKKKLLLIGIDAMSPLIVERLLKKGLMPNFAKLQYAPLATTTPPETPVAWSAAASGCNPGKFGIFDFIDRDPSSYLPRLCLTEEKQGLMKTEYTSQMKGVPFWQRLGDSNIPCTVVRWPVTFPAAPIKGRLFAGLGTVDVRGSLNSYTFYTDDEETLKSKGAEKVVIVPVGESSVSTLIPGPVVKKRGASVQIKAGLKIERTGPGVVLQAGDTRIELKAGKWSPFFRVAFEILPFHFVRGIANAYLVSSEPHLRLYLSSVQLDPSNQAYPLTSPAEYGRELEEAVGLMYTLGMPEETKAVTEGKLPIEAFLEQIDEIEGQREKHFRYELERFREGVLAFIFDAGDRLQHLTWEEVREDSDYVPEAIERYYRRKDALLGEVLARMGDDTALIIMSDHGFAHFTRQVNINRWLLERGFLKLGGDENAELFKAVDWSGTRAYAVGFTSMFLNLKGREGSGIVEAGQTEELLNDICRELLNLKDGDRPVISSVHRSKDIYKGVFAGAAPDLVVGFYPGYRMAWQSALGMPGSTIFSDNDSAWKADHLMDSRFVPGVLFTNFKLGREGPRIIDVAPTILAILGLNHVDDMDGVSLI